jgi:hypothetical protein
MRILHWADTTYVDKDKKPVPASVVINISYGILAGPKDGTGFLEREIARLVRLRNQRLKGQAKTVVVLPSGNGFRERTRARMALSSGEAAQTILRVQPQDMSVTFVEIWIPKANGLTLKITPPLGCPQEINLSKAPQIFDWVRDNHHTIGRIYVQDPPLTNKRRIMLALCPTINHDPKEFTVPTGAYGLAITNKGKQEATVDIDVQRDDTPSSFRRYGRQSYLDGPEVDRLDPSTLDRLMPDESKGDVTRSGTMSAHATSTEDDIIVVGGAFDRHALQEQAALYSASGLGLSCGGPALAAVSEETRVHPGRLAAGFFSGSTVVFSGTSMAAPLVARAIVERLLESKGVDYDLSDLIRAPFASKDARLGIGVMDYAELPGRLPRRIRA